MSKTTWSYSVALGLLLVACGAGQPEDPGHWRQTTEELPSGAQRVVNPASGLWGPAEAWRLEETLRIGSIDGEDPYLFGWISDIAVDAQGSIYLLEGQSREVRVFDAAGQYSRTIARSGAGPGELANPVALRWLPGHLLLVVDYGNARYSVFDTIGSFLTSARRNLPPQHIPWRGAVDGKGNVYEWITVREAGQSDPREVLVRLDSAFVVQDTFDIAVPEIETLTVTVDGGLARYSIPFGPTLRWWLDAERAEFWRAGSADYHLVKTSFTGDTLMLLERAYEPVTVLPDERDDAIEELADQGLQLTRSQVPERKPAFSYFVVDSEGNLWVRTTVKAGVVFDLFDPIGRYLGQVESPVELEPIPAPVVTSEAVYGVVRDSSHVEYVVRLEIERSE